MLQHTDKNCQMLCQFNNIRLPPPQFWEALEGHGGIDLGLNLKHILLKAVWPWIPCVTSFSLKFLM